MDWVAVLEWAAMWTYLMDTENSLNVRVICLGKGASVLGRPQQMVSAPPVSHRERVSCKFSIRHKRGFPSPPLKYEH